jgi:hypothetical protein
MGSDALNTSAMSSGRDSGIERTADVEEEEEEEEKRREQVMDAEEEAVSNPPPPAPLRGTTASSFHLTFIDFSNNHIATIPKEFFDQEHLDYVDLSHNNLTNLGDKFGSARCVKYLDVSCNFLEELPAWFNQLPKAKVINLSGNNMAAPAAFNAVTTDFGNVGRRLRVLNLANCGMSNIKEAVFSPKDMTRLILGSADGSSCGGPRNTLDRLPGLTLAVGLVYLVVPNVGLKELPQDIGLLKNLRYLDVSSNGLIKLSWYSNEQHTLVRLKRLEYLDASSNVLECLPPGIDQMPRLAELLLAHNNLSWITDDIPNARDNLKILVLLFLVLFTLPADN